MSILASTSSAFMVYNYFCFDVIVDSKSFKYLLWSFISYSIVEQLLHLFDCAFAFRELDYCSINVLIFFKYFTFYYFSFLF